MIRCLITSITLCLSIHLATAQVDTVAKKEKTTSFIAIPLLGYSQETNLSFGASVLYSFYADTAIVQTRQSNLFFGGTYTLNKQSNIGVYANIWSPQNKYHYVADFYYNKFPFNFYGVGNDTRLVDEDKITNIGSRISVDVERKLGKVFYAGVNSIYQQDKFSDIQGVGIFSADTTIGGKTGGKLFFAGLSAIYDTRNYATYATNGHYVKLNVAMAPKLANDFYRLTRFQLQTRSFFTLGSEKNSIAVHSIFTSLQGPIIPFYLIGNFGGSNMMRGYYTGRFREQNLAAAQIEYRWWPLKRFAFIPFVGTGTVFKNKENVISVLKPNFGGGVRYFFDIKSRLTIRVDYGFGEKRPNEKRSQGVIIGISESF